MIVFDYLSGHLKELLTHMMGLQHRRKEDHRNRDGRTGQ